MFFPIWEDSNGMRDDTAFVYVFTYNFVGLIDCPKLKPGRLQHQRRSLYRITPKINLSVDLPLHFFYFFDIFT